jgi:hypothetical protein
MKAAVAFSLSFERSTKRKLAMVSSLVVGRKRAAHACPRGCCEGSRYTAMNGDFNGLLLDIAAVVAWCRR